MTLLLAFGLASCVHTAISPVATPSGDPIAIRIPGVAKGAKPKQSQVMAIDEKLLEGMTPDTLVWRYFPELEGRGQAAATLLGFVGEVKTKRGETIHAYIPLVAMRASAPPSRVEEAAAKMAADVYKKAKKGCEIYPLSQIADRPKS